LKPLDEAIASDLEQCAGLYAQALTLKDDEGKPHIMSKSAPLLAMSVRLSLLAHASRRAAHAAAEAAALDAIQAIASDGAWAAAMREAGSQRDASLARADDALRAIREGPDASSDALLAAIRSRVEAIDLMRTGATGKSTAPAAEAPAPESPATSEPPASETPSEQAPGDAPASEPAPVSEPPAEPAADPASRG
jgi:hypothetical protein